MSAEHDPFSLDSAIETATPEACRFVFYGPQGIGKTTLLRYFPRPIALFTEQGWRNLPIPRFPQVAASYGDVVRAIASTLKDPRDRQTFGLDSVTNLEPLVWREACARNNWSDIEQPGYGRGYVAADEVWAELLQGCDALQAAGLHVVLLGHSEITKFNPPESESYNRYDLALHSRSRAMVHRWADVVGFCYEKVGLVQKTEGAGKSAKTTTRGGGTIGRFVALQRKSTHEAKNGYGLPAEIPLSPDNSTAEGLLDMIAQSYVTQ